MLETSARLLRLLTLLQARGSWPGPELAGRLEITERTLRRDVDKLRALGYPVDSATGTMGGYKLGAGASLPPLQLDDDEAVAVAVGLQTAASGSVAGLESASLRALAKLEQVLPSRLKKRLGTLRASIVRLGAAGPTVELSDVAVLAAACSEKRAVRFAYRDHGGEPTERNVEPYRLVHTGARWYLVAWDTGRGAWRTFRVDRIAPPLTPGPFFEPRSLPDEDLTAYVTRSLSSSPYRYQGSVVLHAPADAVRDRVSPYGGKVEPIDDRRCRLRTGAQTLDGLVVCVAMLGVEFEVEEPPELFDALHALVARLERAARGKGGRSTQ